MNHFRPHNTMLYSFNLCILLVCFLCVSVETNAEITWSERITGLPVDEAGWTILTPSADSRLIYVSREGNDSTARFYSPDDPEIGSDPRNPIGEVNAFATIIAAKSHMRRNFPDWLMFKCNEEWDDQPGRFNIERGRNSSERIVITNYGEGERPIFNLTNHGIRISGGGVSQQDQDNFAVIGLHFKRGSSSSGISLLSPVNDWLFEDCRFEQSNVSTATSPFGDRIWGKRFVFRRCTIDGNYPIGTAHTQGMFASGIQKYLIEDNFTDNNGFDPLTGDDSNQPWIISTVYNALTDKVLHNGTHYRCKANQTHTSTFETEPGIGASWQDVWQVHNYRDDATIFNHNYYLSASCRAFILQFNISSRASATGLAQGPEGIQQYNLFVDNPVQSFIHKRVQNRGDDFTTRPSFVRQNVTLGGNNVNSQTRRGTGFQLIRAEYDIYEDNILSNFRNGTGSIIAFAITQGSDIAQIGPATVKNNIVYNWANNNSGTAFNIGNGETTVDDNIIQQISGGTIIRTDEIPIHSGNLGYSTNDNVNIEGWTNLSEPYPFSDPGRDIFRYCNEVLGQSFTDIDDAQLWYFEQLRNMHRGNWDERFRAEAVINWIREGYDREPISSLDLVMVPEVVGILGDEGASLLVTEGMTVPRVLEEYHDTIPEGQAIRTEPLAFTFLERGTSVELVVSLGPSHFPARENSTTAPPDPTGAVGPEFLMSVERAGIRIQNKDGSVVSSITLNDFWQPLLLGSGAEVHQSRVLFDPHSERYFVTAVTHRRSADSQVVLAVSQTSNPGGQWNYFSFDADTANEHWVDYANIGFTVNRITLTANRYAISNDTFRGVNVWTIDKASLFTEDPVDFQRQHFSDIQGVLTPVATYDDGVTTQYFVSAYEGENSIGRLRVFSISGNIGSLVFSPASEMPTASPWSAAPPDAPQPDLVGTLITTNIDDRIMNAVLRNGSLWCTHTVGLPAVNPTRSAVQWWEINAGTGAKVQSGIIEGQGDGLFFYYPGIAVNKDNEVLLGFSGSSTTVYPSAYHAYRMPITAMGAMEEITQYKAGTGPFSGGAWGRYSGAAVDPTDDKTLWTLQQYSETAPGAYGTWWGRIRPPEDFTDTTRPQVSSATALDGQTVRIVFDEPMFNDANLVNASFYTFTGGGIALTATNINRINPITVDVTVNEMTNGAAYTVQVSTSGPSDLAGNLINPAANSASFTGVAVAPVVSNVTVQSAQSVDVTFSKPMGTGVLTASNYTVSGSGRGSLAENPNSVTSMGNNVYRLSWTAGEMVLGSNITITAANMQDTGNNALGTPNSATHTGGAIGVRPTVTAVNVAAANVVDVTFSEPMGTGVGTTTNYSISGAGRGSLATNPNTVTSQGNNVYRLTWTAGEMVLGGSITITASNVRDVAGNLIGTPNSGTHTNGAIATPPTVTNVAVTGARTVDVTFSEAMSGNVGVVTNYIISGSGRGSLATNPNSVASQGSNTYRLTWNSGEMVNNGDITITVSNVTDIAGNIIGNPNSGTHAGAGIGTAPTVINVSVVTGQEVDVTFSESMGAGVTTAANYAISGSGQGSLGVNPNSVVLLSGNTYRLNWVDGEMTIGGDVTITVSNVQDVAGNVIGVPNSATHVGGGVGVPPVVENVAVVDGLNVDVTFSKPMNEVDVLTASNYTLSGSGQGTLAATPDSVSAVSGNTYRLTWNIGEMRDGGNITITVADVEDSLGNLIGDPDFGTHTGGAIGTSPVVTAVQVVSGQAVDVTFSKAMGNGILAAVNYKLSGDGQGSLDEMPDSVTDEGANTYRLIWDEGKMRNGGDITITVVNVSDTAGNPIGTPDFGTYAGGAVADLPTVTQVAVQSDSSVAVTFSDIMGAGVTDPGKYTLSGPGQGSRANNPDSVTLQSGNTYRLTWNAGEFIEGEMITITVDNSAGNAVEDEAGNPLGTPNDGSDLVDGIVDVPVVTEVNVAEANVVDVTFSKTMGIGVTTPANYTMSGSGQGTLAANPDSVVLQAGNTYRLSWNDGEMRIGGNVTITVDMDNVEDEAGNNVGSPNSGTHAGGGIGTRPVVDSIAAQTSQSIQITFSEALADSGATTAANYTLSGAGQGSLSNHPEHADFVATGVYLLTWDNGEMLQDGDITITVANVRDLAGNLIGTPDSATEVGGGIGILPTVVSVTVLSERSLDLVFSEAMAANATNPSLYTIEGSGLGTLSENPHQISQRSETRFRLIWTSGEMQDGGDITVTANGMTDLVGNPMGDPDSATHAGGAIGIAPRLLSISVHDGRAINATFDESMGASALDEGNYTLSGTGMGTLTSQPDAVALVSGNTYRLTWNQGDMLAGGDLTITVANVADLAGNEIGEFNTATVEGEGQSELPVLTDVTVTEANVVQVSFNKTMGAGVDSTDSYTISGTGRGSLAEHPDSVSLVSDNTYELVWNSGEMLTGGDVVITVQGVFDEAGNPMGVPDSAVDAGGGIGIAPTVSAVSVISGHEVEILFSEAMGAGVSNPINYALSGSGQGTLSTQPVEVTQVDPATYRLHWISGDMVQGGDITITTSNVFDLIGNEIGMPDSATAPGAGISIPPEVISVNVQSNRVVHITFSEPMGEGVLDAANYSLSGSGQGSLSAQPNEVELVSGNTYRLAWSTGDMTINGDITITVVNVRDASGVLIGSNNTGTDANAGQGTAPVVQSVQVVEDRAVVVTFSKSMGAGVLTPSNYNLSGSGQGTLNSTPDNVSFIGDNAYQLIWNSGKMQIGGDITISVSNIFDDAGNAIGTPDSGTHIGGGQGDSPGINISAPTPDATREGPVVFTVTYTDVDEITLTEDDVSLYFFAGPGIAGEDGEDKSAGVVEGDIAVTGEGNVERTVTVTNISGNGGMGLRINAGTARDEAGNVTPEVVSTQLALVDNTPPQVRRIEIVDKNIIDIFFNEPMGQNAINPNNYRQSGEGGGSLDPRPNVVVLQDAQNHVYRLTWTAGEMRNDAMITVTAENVTDALGNVIADQNSASAFVRGLELNPIAVSLQVRTPLTMDFTFSERMGQGSLVATNYTLSGPGQGSLAVNPISVSQVADATYRLSWSTGEMLTGATVTVTATNMFDPAGNPIDTGNNSATHVGGGLGVAPQVLSVLVANGSEVLVRFSEPMGSGVLTTTNYVLSGSGRGTLASNPQFVEPLIDNIYRLRWELGQMIQGGDITVQARSVRDVVGNLIGQPDSATHIGGAVVDTLNILANPERDVTLYEDDNGTLASGSGHHLLVGINEDSLRRRAILAFDIEEEIPAHVTIIDAALTMYVSEVPETNNSSSLRLVRSLASWGEGASADFIEDEEGFLIGGKDGAPAEPGDATWIHRFYNNQNWSQPGGEFSDSTLDAIVVNGVGFYQFSSASLRDDVLDLVMNPDDHHGWFLLSDENEPGKVIQFNSREHDEIDSIPLLRVSYDLNIPPELDPIADQSIDEGQELRVPLRAEKGDIGGLTLLMDASNLPAGHNAVLLDNSNGTGEFVWTPGFDDSGVYLVTIIVRDSDTPPQTDSEVFVITVNDVNRPPVLSPIGNRSVDEGQTLAFTLSASDPDDEDTLTFSMNNAPEGAVLNPITGAFTWTPGFIDAGVYTVTFIVSDDGVPVMSDSETIDITVINVNRAPVLAPIGNQTVNEGQTLAITISASDPDPGDTLTFSMQGAPSGATLDAATGQFSWTPGFTDAGNYVISFTVQDNGEPPLSDSEEITITVNPVNRPPSDINLSSNTIPENEPAGTTIGVFSVEDPDEEDTHLLSLVSGEGSEDNARFVIDGNTLLSNAVFNYEVRSQYSIRVRATDEAGAAIERIFTIHIIDVNDPPTDILLSNDQVPENQPIGTLVGILMAVDEDEDDEHIFTLVPGEGDNDNEAFRIEEDRLVTNVVFEYEVQNIFSIRVQADDERGGTFEKVFIIQIIDVNDPPTDILLSRNTIPQDAVVGYPVATLQAVDPDLNDVHTFQLVPGTGDIDNTAFYIEGNGLFMNANVDIAAQEVYVIRIRTIDRHGESFTRFFELTVIPENEGWLPPPMTVSQMAQYLLQHFDAVDTNNNNRLSLTEVRAAIPYITQSQFNAMGPVSGSLIRQSLLNVIAREPRIEVSPASRQLNGEAGSTSIEISNAGNDVVNWQAVVISGDFITINSGATGSNNGMVTLFYTANTGDAPRHGALRITSAEAGNSPVDVLITQYPCDLPEMPTNVNASDGLYRTHVEITWSAAEGATAYEVYRHLATAPQSTAILLATVVGLSYNDTSAQAPQRAPGAGCIGPDNAFVPVPYFYCVRAINECGPSEFATCNLGYRGHILGTADVFERSMPKLRSDDAFIYASPEDTLSIRLRSNRKLNIENIWGQVAIADVVSDVVMVDPVPDGDGKDFWVHYIPEEPMLPGEVVTMTVGATSFFGDVGPYEYQFLIYQDADIIDKNLVPVWQPTYDAYDSRSLDRESEGMEESRLGLADTEQLKIELRHALGDVYQILSESVFDIPQRVWIAIPDGLQTEDVALYYYHENHAGAGWYPAEQVAGWLVEGSMMQLTLEDTTYLGFLVRHGAIVQLGLPVEDTAITHDLGSVGATNLSAQDFLGLAIFTLLIVAIPYFKKRGMYRQTRS